MPSTRVELATFPGAADLAAAAGACFLEQLAAAARNQKRYSVALSGGRIAQTFFAWVTRAAKTPALLFPNTHFFWADERCVPPDNPESNFRIAQELLFAPLAIPDNQVHRVRGENPPDAAARSAETELISIVGTQSIKLSERPLETVPWLSSESYPVLDLVLLGMGEDGHVASLFPGEPDAVAWSRPVYRAIGHSPKPPSDRVTLGYPALAAARSVWVLVSGPGKEGALRESLRTGGKTPLARVLELRSHTRIFTDIRPGL